MPSIIMGMLLDWKPPQCDDAPLGTLMWCRIRIDPPAIISVPVEPSVRSACVAEIVLLALAITRVHIWRASVAYRDGELAACGSGDVRRQQASMPIRHGGIVGEPRFDLAARPLLANDDRAASIEANCVERILANMMPIVAMVAIDLLDMAVLDLTLAPSQHYSPVGGARPDDSITGPCAIDQSRNVCQTQVRIDLLKSFETKAPRSADARFPSYQHRLGHSLLTAMKRNSACLN
jgi:hypothetical protein